MGKHGSLGQMFDGRDFELMRPRVRRCEAFFLPYFVGSVSFFFLLCFFFFFFLLLLLLLILLPLFLVVLFFFLLRLFLLLPFLLLLFLFFFLLFVLLRNGSVLFAPFRKGVSLLLEARRKRRVAGEGTDSVAKEEGAWKELSRLGTREGWMGHADTRRESCIHRLTLHMNGSF